MRKPLIVGVIILLITMGLTPSTETKSMEQSFQSALDSNTLYVGGDGSGNYSKIQDAIDNINIIEKEQQDAIEVSDGYSDHVWPFHKNDPQRTGRCLYDTSQNKGGEKWKYFIDSSIWGTVTIDKDGIIYVGTSTDGLHAVYPDGTRKWKRELEGGEYQAPVIAPDGTIYVGTTDLFYAFYPNGTLKWVFNVSANFFCEPAVDYNGTVYVGTQDGIVYAIYSNGTLKWEYDVQDYVFYIALDHDENIYFNGIYKIFLTCLTPDGNVKWKYKRTNIWDGPVFDEDGTIYVNAIHYLIALYPNGTEKWVIDYNENDFYGYPSISPDGTIILSGGGDYITAVDPADGSVIWQNKIEEWSHMRRVSNAAIGRDGSVFFAYDAYSDSLAFLSVLNPNGSLKWETHLTTDVHPYDGVNILSDPSIGSDGTVYITSWFFRGGSNYTNIGYIHAIGMNDSVAPEAPSVSGPVNCTFDVEYEFTFCAVHPNGDDVYYLVDFFDGAFLYNNFWRGPYHSGVEVKINHTWYKDKYTNKKSYTIRARAKSNESTICGPWSELEVTMPKNKPSTTFSWIHWFLERFPHAFPIIRHFLGL